MNEYELVKYCKIKDKIHIFTPLCNILYLCTEAIFLKTKALGMFSYSLSMKEQIASTFSS